MKITKISKKVNYSCVLVENPNYILEKVKKFLPDISTWEILCHHMTINLGPLPDNKREEIGKIVELTASEIAYNDKVAAVKVSGYESKNANPHITIAVNRSNGGKPVMSNELQNWQKIPPFTIKGTITEI
jgi:hypothetical protein